MFSVCFSDDDRLVIDAGGDGKSKQPTKRARFVASDDEGSDKENTENNAPKTQLGILLLYLN